MFIYGHLLLSLVVGFLSAGVLVSKCLGQQAPWSAGALGGLPYATRRHYLLIIWWFLTFGSTARFFQADSVTIAIVAIIGAALFGGSMKFCEIKVMEQGI